MQLFYAPDIRPPQYTLSEEESKHCVRVLRLACGDTVHLTDGRGTLYRCEITDDNPRRCVVRVVSDEEEFERVKDSFVLTPEKLETAKKEMVVLHPLPRVNEITRAVDNDPRAAYFRQVENGKFVRMALIYTLLQWAGERKAAPTPHLTEAYDVNRLRCQNRRCISATEDVDQLFHEIDGEPGSYRCAYCEAKLRG